MKFRSFPEKRTDNFFIARKQKKKKINKSENSKCHNSASSGRRRIECMLFYLSKHRTNVLNIGPDTIYIYINFVF